jgi:hypothetical protein
LQEKCADFPYHRYQKVQDCHSDSFVVTFSQSRLAFLKRSGAGFAARSVARALTRVIFTDLASLAGSSLPICRRGLAREWVWQMGA